MTKLHLIDRACRVLWYTRYVSSKIFVPVLQCCMPQCLQGLHVDHMDSQGKNFTGYLEKNGLLLLSTPVHSLIAPYPSLFCDTLQVMLWR